MIIRIKKYLSKTNALIVIILFFRTFCYGQVENHLLKENLVEQTINEGLPRFIKSQGAQESDNVNSSLQDKAGNLWFGTSREGLYKFDGNSFAQFTITDGLASNAVGCILEDKDGRLWIGTEAGVCVYDGRTFSKVEIPLRKDMPSNKVRNSHNVFSIMQDKGGKIWFATIDGVYVYNGKTFTPFIIKEGVGGFMSSNHNVEYILEDKAGNIWFGGRNNEGVFRYDGKSITNLEIAQQNEWNWAFPVLQDKNGHIWFSNWSGAYRYDGRSFIRFGKKDGLLSDIVIRIIEDKKGNLWFGCAGNKGSRDGGLCRFDGKKFTCLTTADGRINKDVWTILEDQMGQLWVGTKNTGLWRYDGNSITHFTEKDDVIQNPSLMPSERK